MKKQSIVPAPSWFNSSASLGSMIHMAKAFRRDGSSLMKDWQESTEHPPSINASKTPLPLLTSSVEF